MKDSYNKLFCWISGCVLKIHHKENQKANSIELGQLRGWQKELDIMTVLKWVAQSWTLWVFQLWGFNCIYSFICLPFSQIPLLRMLIFVRIFVLGRSWYLVHCQPCTFSYSIFHANFNVFKLIIDWKFHKKE